MVLAVRPPASTLASRPTGLDALERAVIEALVYADVFDWALTPAEVHRYLPVPAEPADVDAALSSLGARRAIEAVDGFVTLAGRSGLVAERRRRTAASARLWRRSLAYGRVVASLPWVRLVAVSGSLAVDAAADDADVDLFVVTEDDRLWLARALTIGVVRLAATRGLTLCPNYLLARSALELPDRDRFTAHELAQLVPLAGADAYGELLHRNAWYRTFLPNHPGATEPLPFERAPGARAAERALSGRIVDRLERSEMSRKVRRLTEGSDSSELRFGPTVCKGHRTEHRRRALAAFEERLAATLATIE